MAGKTLIETLETTSVKRKDTQPPQHCEALGSFANPQVLFMNLLWEPEPSAYSWTNRGLVRGSPELNVGAGSGRKGVQDPPSSLSFCGFQRESLAG